MITIDVNLPTLSEEARKRLADEMRRPCNVLMVGALIRAVMEHQVTIAPPKVGTGRLKGSGKIG